MRLEDIKAYCLNKWKAYEDYPFGDIPICYKLNGKVSSYQNGNQRKPRRRLALPYDKGGFSHEQIELYPCWRLTKQQTSAWTFSCRSL